MQLPENKLRKQGGACFYVILEFLGFLFCKGSARGQAGGAGKEWSVFLHSLLDKMKAVTQESLWKLLLPKPLQLEQSPCRATSLSVPLFTLK